MERINTRDEQGEPTYEVVDGKRLFRNGEPHGPEKLPATQLDALWFNSVQEELCNFIEKEGLILDEGNKEQLKEAVYSAAVKVFREKIEIYRTTLNALREHVLDRTNPVPGEIPESEERTDDE